VRGVCRCVRNDPRIISGCFGLRQGNSLRAGATNPGQIESPDVFHHDSTRPRIDPGLQITGYGVIETASARRASVRRASSAPPALAIWSAVFARSTTACWKSSISFHPDVMAVEQLYAHYIIRGPAILMAHARGIAFLAAAQRGLDVVSYNATRIKRRSPGRVGRRRSRCSGLSSASWGWPTCPSRRTSPTPSPSRCAIITLAGWRPIAACGLSARAKPQAATKL